MNFELEAISYWLYATSYELPALFRLLRRLREGYAEGASTRGLAIFRTLAMGAFRNSSGAEIPVRWDKDTAAAFH